MDTLFDPDVRREILNRVDELEPEFEPRWGGFSAPEMVCHCNAALQQGFGEHERDEASGPLSYWPLNWLVIHILPWPKGVKTDPNLLDISPGDWQDEVERLTTLIERFGKKGHDGNWPPHGMFGDISGRSWGVVQYRHLDHHLRQFGV